MTSSPHPHVTVLLEGYEAFAEGDLDRLPELWTDDVRWHEPGTHPLAGDYTGPQELVGLFGLAYEVTGGSFRVDVRSAFADDTDGVAVVRMTARRGDRDLDVLAAHLVRFEDGRIAEFWDAHTDQAAVDAFFG
ncbi:nuclear transport factor 2 family protein [Geodermatophilus sp. SYSU D00525]